MIVKNEEQLKDAYYVRKKVFVEEQKVPEEVEIDHLESEATHFVLYDKGEPIGAGRIRFVEDFGKVERICVLNEKRKSGAGKIIMKGIEQFALEKGIEQLKLNAQLHAIPFYEKLQYRPISDIFMEAGIPHKTMMKTLKEKKL